MGEIDTLWDTSDAEDSSTLSRVRIRFPVSTISHINLQQAWLTTRDRLVIERGGGCEAETIIDAIRGGAWNTTQYEFGDSMERAIGQTNEGTSTEVEDEVELPAPVCDLFVDADVLCLSTSHDQFRASTEEGVRWEGV